jgi:hypothetical protein
MQSRQRPFPRPAGLRGANMSLVKIIIITLAVILTILFLGRFLF